MFIIITTSFFSDSFNFSFCQNNDFSINNIQFESITEKNVIFEQKHILNVMNLIEKCYNTKETMFYFDVKILFDNMYKRIEIIIREKFFYIDLDYIAIILKLFNTIRRLIIEK